ncbi:MAG TPA: hypothetical protein VMW69_11650, partial [Spirochaetia bacterium]|nr:hypothetical protein [Spirochaetia bacterium]
MFTAHLAVASPSVVMQPADGGTAATTPASGMTLTMGSYTGVEYGVAKELVYYSDSYYNYYKVSELDWPLEPS